MWGVEVQRVCYSSECEHSYCCEHCVLMGTVLVQEVHIDDVGTVC